MTKHSAIMAIAGKRLIRVFLGPYFIALILSIPICIYLTRVFPAYIVTLDSARPALKKDGIIYVHDMDYDGFSEEILSFTDTKGRASVQIYKLGKIIELFDFEGSLPFKGVRLLFGDHDKDRLQELFAFYVRNDSLFLAVIEFGSLKEKIIDDRYIAFLGNDLGLIDCNIYECGFYDCNGDGADEVIFSVMAGFPVFPRNVFMYDIRNDLLLESPFTGAAGRIREMSDIDGDNRKELFFQNYAYSNMKSMKYDGMMDTSAWLIVLDGSLNFKFPPVEFSGYTTGVFSTPFTRKDSVYIGVIVRRKTFPSKPVELYVFNSGGQMKGKRFFDTPEGESEIEPVRTSDAKDFFSFIDGNGYLNEYDENLNLVRKKKIIPSEWHAINTLDLDLDGKMEHVFYIDRGSLVITRGDYTRAASLNIDLQLPLISSGIKLNGDAPPSFMLHTERRIYMINYYKNPLFYWQFPIYIGVYLLLYLIIMLVMYLQRKILRDKYNAEKKISELQLMMVKDQLDPHFMFNAMNTINSLVVLKKPEEAQQRILGLSRLMRTMVESSGKIAQSIEKEIEFTRNYLEFQKNRYGDLFTYQIEIEDEVNLQWQVPRMVLQILVENSIKHGLLPKGRDGVLTILLKKNAENILIVVEDNGIGREASRKNPSGSTGKGLSILEQNFTILNKYNSEKAKFEIEDIYLPDQSIAGTKITLIIPINLNYRIYER